MQVLKPGRPQKEWAVEAECTGAGNKGGGCGAVLLVEKGDLFQTYSSCMGRDEEWYVTFRCMSCGVWTDLNKSPFNPRDLPTYVEKATNEKLAAERSDLTSR